MTASVKLRTAGETPSQQLTRNASESKTVTDARGRTIEIRKPRPITRLRFIEAMGSGSTNQLWMAHILPLLYVTKIDCADVTTPISKLEIEALYERLDDDGMEAVSAGLAELGVAQEVDTAAARKNSE